MDSMRNRVASAIRMCLFSVIAGVFAIMGEKPSDMGLACVFVLLACNELYYIIGCVIDERREMAPKRKSRKKTKKYNPIRKHVIQLVIAECFAGTILWSFHANGITPNVVAITITVLVAALISVLF